LSPLMKGGRVSEGFVKHALRLCIASVMFEVKVDFLMRKGGGKGVKVFRLARSGPQCTLSLIGRTLKKGRTREACPYLLI
jgi:hypothetical protein